MRGGLFAFAIAFLASGVAVPVTLLGGASPLIVASAGPFAFLLWQRLLVSAFEPPKGSHLAIFGNVAEDGTRGFTRYDAIYTLLLLAGGGAISLLSLYTFMVSFMGPAPGAV